MSILIKTQKTLKNWWINMTISTKTWKNEFQFKLNSKSYSSFEFYSKAQTRRASKFQVQNSHWLTLLYYLAVSMGKFQLYAVRVYVWLQRFSIFMGIQFQILCNFMRFNFMRFDSKSNEIRCSLVLCNSMSFDFMWVQISFNSMQIQFANQFWNGIA